MKQKREKNHLPQGWSESRVRSLAAYYDHQSDEAAAREIERGFNRQTETMIIVPKKLLPAIKALIAKNKRRVG